MLIHYTFIALLRTTCREGLARLFLSIHVSFASAARSSMAGNVQKCLVLK